MNSSVSHSRIADLTPAIITAIAFALSDVFAKMAFAAGMDPLSLSMFRSTFSLVFMIGWLWWKPPPEPHTPRQRWISLGVGVLFAGIVFSLFKAIELATVPVAILSYFVYPLLTGIAGTLIGIDRLSWRGATAAVVAFVGLSLIVGANPETIALGGLAFAFGGACLRTTVLLVTRAALQGADPRLITWYATASSTAVFIVWSLATLNWHGPQTGVGWFALMVVSVSVTVAVLTMFMSIQRIGPFRTALVMNLEPLLATLMSWPLLGEVLTPIQALGGAIMLAALVAFQLRR
jgi:drug/metabolite transporter (DMT)-like permease